MTTGKTIALTRRTFVEKVMSLLFNMLSSLVITFLPRSKHLLISWLQSADTNSFPDTAGSGGSGQYHLGQWEWPCVLTVLVAQSCPTLCDPMDCSPPGSSVHEVLQARILEWVATQALCILTGPGMGVQGDLIQPSCSLEGSSWVSSQKINSSLSGNL